MWIDKDSFLPFRLEGERDGATESVLNLRYRGAPAVETLSEWDYTAYLYGSGTVLEAGSARKVQVDVDCDTSDSVFRIAYPPGTLVDDKRSGRWVHLVATADGSLKPRSAVLQPKPVVGKWIIVTAVALVIFSIMIVVFRRLRK